MRYAINNDAGVLVLYADRGDARAIRAMIAAHGCSGCSACEMNALEHLIAYSELQWIEPIEIGALTGAPILGYRGPEQVLPAHIDSTAVHVTHHDDHGQTWYAPVVAAWGYMDYQIRSFLDDLMQYGKASFTSGT